MRPLIRAAGFASALFLMMAGCAAPVADAPLDEDGGTTEEDGGAIEQDAGAPEEDGGAAHADGGRAIDGGETRDGGAADAGARDAGADGGRLDGGRADAGPDAGADAGPLDCSIPVGTTTCGASKIFETSDPGPSAFDFAVGRVLLLASEVTPSQGDFFLFSLETQTMQAGDVTRLTLVSPRQSTSSGGERGVFRATGIEDLTLLDGGPTDPATFTALPEGLVFREATKALSGHPVHVVPGHIYGMQLDLRDGGAPSRYAAIVVDRIVTPILDGGLAPTRQWVEFRWLYQSQPGRRTFDRAFPPP